MTTATKNKSASAELAALQKIRDRLHAKVRRAKAAMSAWDSETEAMKGQLTALVNAHPDQTEGADKRVRPGTEAAKLRDQIREGMRGENPYRGAYEEAFGPYEQADLAVQEFKRTRLDDRLAELDPDANRAIDRLRDAFAQLEEASAEYEELVIKKRDVIIDTPGLDGRDAGHDPRPSEWRLLARGVLEGEIATPGLTEVGAAKAASHV